MFFRAKFSTVSAMQQRRLCEHACVPQREDGGGCGDTDVLTDTEYGSLLRQRCTQCFTSFYVMRGVVIYFNVLS